MAKLIVVDQDDLQEIIESSIKRAFRSEGNLKEQNSTEHFNVDQAATFLDLAKQTIYGLTYKDLIPHYKRGKKLYFLKAELEKWMLEGKQPVKQKSTVFIKTKL